MANQDDLPDAPWLSQATSADNAADLPDAPWASQPKPVQRPVSSVNPLYDTATDVAKSAGAGLVSGSAGLLDLPASVLNLAGKGVGKAAQWSGQVSPETVEKAESYLPSGHAVQDWAANLTGGFSQYQPQTTAGRYTKNVAEFVPAATAAALTGGTSLIPEVLAGAVVPGIASEAAGEVAHAYAPNIEGAVRFGTALASGRVAQGALENVASKGAATLSSTADSAIQSATKRATGDQPALTAADIPDEHIQTFTRTMQTKGETPAAAKEAIIKSATGMKAVPTALTTDTPVSREFMPAVQSAVMNGKQAIADNLSSMAPEVSNPGAELATPLYKAFSNGKSAIDDAYSAARETPATFAGAMDNGDALRKSIDAQLQSKLGSSLDFYESSSSYPSFKSALNNLTNVVGNRPMTMNEVASERQAMNEAFPSTTGSDRIALRALIDGYDDYFADLAKRGIGDGDLSGAMDKYKKASSMYRDFQDTFYPDAAISPGMPNASKAFSDIYKADAASTDTLMPHNNSISKNILDPNKGQSTYNGMLSAIQKYAPDEVDNFNNGVKANILAPSDAANRYGFALRPPQLSGVINGVGSKVMSPDEIKTLKLNLTAQRLLDQKLAVEGNGESMTSAITKAFGNLAGRAGTAALGYYFGEIPGAIAAEIGSRGLSEIPATFKRAQTQTATFSGAPVTGMGGRAQQYLRSAAPFNPAINAQPPADTNNQEPVHRATGGKVGDGASKLMRLAEQAKRAENNQTESILKVPDEAVVKALDVAKQAI